MKLHTAESSTGRPLHDWRNKPNARTGEMAFPGNAHWQPGPWYTSAARKALGKAHCDLGQAHSAGYYREDVNERKSFENIRESACKGDPTGQFELGKCYDDGFGVESDPHTAVGWYNKAARQGHAKAICTLGWCYAKGHGVEKSEEKAFALFLRAAQLKSPEGQYNLGVCYAKGRGVPKNDERAVEMYRKAANQGHTEAMCNLANCLEHGQKGLEGETAVSWYERAMQAGSEKGKYNLARCHHKGICVESDSKKAAAVLGKAVWKLGPEEPKTSRSRSSKGTARGESHDVEHDSGLHETLDWQREREARGRSLGSCMPACG